MSVALCLVRFTLGHVSKRNKGPIVVNNIIPLGFGFYFRRIKCVLTSAVQYK